MVLNPSRERKPTKRPKSTAVGVLNATTALEPLLRVILSIVILKATTDETGASSPVTKTWDCPFALELDVELAPPQPVHVVASNASINTKAKRLMAKLLIARWFWGELTCDHSMGTQAFGDSFITSVQVR